MAVHYKTLRIDMKTHTRLDYLSKLTGKPINDLVKTLSHSDMPNLIQAHAHRKHAEAKEKPNTVVLLQMVPTGPDRWEKAADLIATGRKLDLDQTVAASLAASTDIS